MLHTNYDVVSVGGGLGGATFARQMASSGARALVVEKETNFRDRVRGEVLVPWGVAEAKRLGIYDLLNDGCGHDLVFWDIYFDGAQFVHRNLVETSTVGVQVMTFFHPEMQSQMLDSAEEAGAEVVRGATVTRVEPGNPARLEITSSGETHYVKAGLVAAADGRNSGVRKQAGFEVEHDTQRRFFSGVLLDGLELPDDAMHSWFASSQGLLTYLFPQGNGRVRAYIGYHAASDFKALSGPGDLPRFLDTCRDLGVPPSFLHNAVQAGPLATFDATDSWVDLPYRDGVALIGDAAATSDPTWGQGMSVTLRDVRLLAESVTGEPDVESAGNAYAAAHREFRNNLHTCDGWFTDLLLDIGPEADAVRARAMPLIAEDPTRMLDTQISGPELIADEAARQRFFGEAP